MLALVRSQHAGQHWITALGLVADAALHMEMCEGSQGKAPYWMIRRSIRLLQNLTADFDLSPYRERLDEAYEDDTMFRQLHADLTAGGFPVLPYQEALSHCLALCTKYDAEVEFLIDFLEAPRGFWGHSIGLRRVTGSESRSVRP